MCFPGDLLLKNFGVTSHGRVIFYDYDEICLLTDCVFRDLPQASCEEEETSGEPWFHCGPRDVFPEQWLPFLAYRRRCATCSSASCGPADGGVVALAVLPALLASRADIGPRRPAPPQQLAYCPWGPTLSSCLILSRGIGYEGWRPHDAQVP